MLDGCTLLFWWWHPQMLLRWHPRKGLIKGCWTRFDTKFASNRATIHTPFNIANRRYPNIFFTGQQLYMIIYLDMISHMAPVPEVDFHHVYPKVLEVPKVAFLGKFQLCHNGFPIDCEFIIIYLPWRLELLEFCLPIYSSYCTHFRHCTTTSPPHMVSATAVTAVAVVSTAAAAVAATAGAAVAALKVSCWMASCNFKEHLHRVFPGFPHDIGVLIQILFSTNFSSVGFFGTTNLYSPNIKQPHAMVPNISKPSTKSWFLGDVYIRGKGLVNGVNHDLLLR